MADGTRDYDAEARDTALHKYEYSFDADVMHGFMMKAFTPFFRPGNVLELGSFRGTFTKRLAKVFTDITCVEASADARAAAEAAGTGAKIVGGLIETVSLPRRYDNIVMTHVLEHLDDRVRALGRVNCEWLSDGGRLFLVCPNAQAASRQIAVKMGLVSDCAAITPSEAAHGHRVTYSLDTMERDTRAAGLKVVHRTGIFFKALANFQWDRLLATDIVTPEYLEGCYALGYHYPELCASIMLVCERGQP